MHVANLATECTTSSRGFEDAFLRRQIGRPGSICANWIFRSTTHDFLLALPIRSTLPAPSTFHPRARVLRLRNRAPRLAAAVALDMPYRERPRSEKSQCNNRTVEKIEAHCFLNPTKFSILLARLAFRYLVGFGFSWYSGVIVPKTVPSYIERNRFSPFWTFTQRAAVLSFTSTKC